MQWLSPKMDNTHDNINQDDISNDDLEQELLDLLKENPPHTVPNTTLSSTQGKTYYEEDELILAQLVKSMDNGNQPLSGGSGGGGSDELDMLDINEKEFFDDDDDKKTVKENTFDSRRQKTEFTANVSGSNMSPISPPSSGNNLKGVPNDTAVKADKQPLDVRQAVLDYINPKTTPPGLDLLKNRHKEYKSDYASSFAQIPVLHVY
ncbi:unnamed protein product [Trichobilharzia szidati]|nr:unnamed protein product [Trichobilharzia szidati]